MKYKNVISTLVGEDIFSFQPNITVCLRTLIHSYKARIDKEHEQEF